ncbi:hypothetical protein SLEP1_g27480 [Rubroshorea leprosula]|uniref:Uncharacterized protein n=1 Tax=Rubroshorea leprosula TaxID=152421 RepID=A0AAV5JW33_9ROSI|nr:hypothetical protein SLEP1_g27480 [Rubroshorea leprosula]
MIPFMWSFLLASARDRFVHHQPSLLLSLSTHAKRFFSIFDRLLLGSNFTVNNLS